MLRRSLLCLLSGVGACTPSAPPSAPSTATPPTVAVPAPPAPPESWPAPDLAGMHLEAEYTELSPPVEPGADEEWRLWFRDPPRRIMLHVWRRGAEHGGRVRLWWTPMNHDYDYQELDDWVDCRDRRRHGDAAESCGVHLPEVDWGAVFRQVTSGPGALLESPVAQDAPAEHYHPLLLIEHRSGDQFAHTLIHDPDAHDRAASARGLLFDVASKAEWPYDADGNPIKTSRDGHGGAPGDR